MGAKVRSVSVLGIEAFQVDVEAERGGTNKKITLVGLPDGVLRESKERVKCAIEAGGFSFPNGEVVVSLAPAALPKNGSGFDLPIALSILCADSQLHHDSLRSTLVIGELGLNGSVRPTRGVLSAARLAKRRKLKRLIVPRGNRDEAALVDGLEIYAVASLAEAVRFLKGGLSLDPITTNYSCDEVIRNDVLTLADVMGQFEAKRALEIVAAGGHNLLMAGPPGCGKSMLAKRLPSLLPKLVHEEALEVSTIWSLLGGELDQTQSSGRSAASLQVTRPYRAPHHTTSTAGLIGGGSSPQPGEISLAHRGILFLDELTEFRRDALESLRQPLEEQRVVITRANFRIVYPADFILVAATNACPCGKKGNGKNECQCSKQAIRRYFGKVSGPLLDRIDLQLWMSPIEISEMSKGTLKDTSAEIQNRVQQARTIQSERFGNNHCLNSRMSERQMRSFCELAAEPRQIFEHACEHHKLSARSYTKILKLSRTIADLEGTPSIEKRHIAEALSYRFSREQS